MTDVQTLLDLALRCEKATGRSIGLNCEIARESGWRHVLVDDDIVGPEKVWMLGTRKSVLPPDFTGSIDAAMTLVPDEFSKWVHLGRAVSSDWGAELHWYPSVGTVDKRVAEGKAPTPALALCSAALRARAGCPVRKGECD